MTPARKTDSLKRLAQQTSQFPATSSYHCITNSHPAPPVLIDLEPMGTVSATTHRFVGTRPVFRELVRFLGLGRRAPWRGNASSTERFLNQPTGPHPCSVV